MKKITKTKIMACLLPFVVLISVACDKNDDNDNGDEVNQTDRNFTMMAAMSNYAEIDAGQTASTKGSVAAIREFGAMMVADHTDASGKLKTIAAKLNLPAPDSLDQKHKDLKAQLSTLSGRAFDSVYIHSQVMDHRDAITLFETQIREGKQSELKDFATQTLPKLKMHGAHADSLALQYKR